MKTQTMTRTAKVTLDTPVNRAVHRAAHKAVRRAMGISDDSNTPADLAKVTAALAGASALHATQPEVSKDYDFDDGCDWDIDGGDDRALTS